jgi:hypothetical protein
MIASGIAERAAGVLREAGEDENVAAMWGERRENARELEIRAIGNGRPLIHEDAVGDVNERETERRRGGGHSV